jgi:hypothetical protein
MMQRALEGRLTALEARPPWGLGYSTDAVDRIISERKTAQQRAQHPRLLLDDRGPATQEEKSYLLQVINRPRQQGNSADYLVDGVEVGVGEWHERCQMAPRAVVIRVIYEERDAL